MNYLNNTHDASRDLRENFREKHDEQMQRTLARRIGIPPVLRTRLPYAALASRILSSSKFAGVL